MRIYETIEFGFPEGKNEEHYKMTYGLMAAIAIEKLPVDHTQLISLGNTKRTTNAQGWIYSIETIIIREIEYTFELLIRNGCKEYSYKWI